jgi:ribonuclease-3
MVDLTNADVLRQIEQVVAYSFQNRDLVIEAFTHSSSADDRLDSNERLEFLGDAVLGLVICQVLFQRFTGYLEGDLTKIKSLLVSRNCCAKVTRLLGIQQFLCVGKGMASTKKLPGSIEAGLIEAVIGAIYLDGGLDAAQTFIERVFEPMMVNMTVEGPHGNYKSLLQQYAQEHHGVTPLYVLLDEKGPDHNKCFESEVVIRDRSFPSAWGVTKKEAEQKAALNTLVQLGILEEPTS